MLTPQPIKPETRNRQKTIADFLALGTPIETIAERTGVSIQYIKVLLKGELFNFEVDEARKRLIGERLEEYRKLVAETLVGNLETLIMVRDDPDSKDSDRLRAIEIINQAVVPTAKPRGEVTGSVHVHLTPEQAARAKGAIAEVAGEPGNSTSE